MIDFMLIIFLWNYVNELIVITANYSFIHITTLTLFIDHLLDWFFYKLWC